MINNKISDIDEKINLTVSVLLDRMCSNCIHKYECSKGKEVGSCELWSDTSLTSYRELFDKRVNNIIKQNQGILTNKCVSDIENTVCSTLEEIKRVDYDFQHKIEVINSPSDVTFIVHIKENTFCETVVFNITIGK